MGYITEVWPSRADVAVQRDAAVGRHCATVVVVRSVSGTRKDESAVPTVQLVKKMKT